MPDTDTPPIPRRRWKLLGYIFLAIVLFATWFYWQLVRSNPPIRVSKKTTYITEPIDKNGLPDFRQYLRDQCRAGVTTDNNAAVLLWQATGPGTLDDHAYRAICGEIGIDPAQQNAAAPPVSQGFTALDDETLYERVQEWIASQTSDEEIAVQTILDMPLNRPWTRAEFAPLAEWVDMNQSALDLAVQASRRPRYYSPSTALAGASDEPLSVADLPGQEQARALARGLTVRAMLHLGEGNPEAAWEDLSAVHRLSQLVAQGPSSVELIFAVAIHDLACSGTIALLHHGQLSSQQIEAIRSELDAAPPFAFVTPTINEFERLAYLEVITRMANRDTKRLQVQLGLGSESSLPDRLSIDWNRAMAVGNDYFDRYAAASRSPALVERSQCLAEIDAEIASHATFKEQRSLLLLGLVSRTARSHAAANMASRLFIPPVPMLMNVQDRANVQADLTRTVVSLAEFRLQHGRYPNALAELDSADENVSQIDAFSNEPFVYRPDDAGGYLLYSVFHNGLDDGGNDGREPIVDGEWADERATADYYNDSDYVIRIPRPAFQLSKSPSPEDEELIDDTSNQ